MPQNDGPMAVPRPDSEQAFEIEDWPFYHLARLTALYSQRMDAALKPLGIDVSRWRVLAILRKHGACSVTQLAREAVSRMSTMTKLVQRMAGEGLIEVRSSPEDGRAVEICLSAAGASKLGDVQKRVSRIGAVALDGVTHDRIETLNQVCREIYRNLSL